MSDFSSLQRSHGDYVPTAQSIIEDEDRASNACALVAGGFEIRDSLSHSAHHNHNHTTTQHGPTDTNTYYK
eukprot:scaffold33370_cov62-Cyclotella_meneghiniana.AAC.3